MNLVAALLATVAVYAFFLPWIAGTGSVFQPIDEVTGIFQKIDFTGLTKNMIGISKNVVDGISHFLSGGKTRQTLSGYEIPFSDDPSIKKMGPMVYVVYLPPALAVICALLMFAGNSKYGRDFLAGIIAWGTYFITQSQLVTLNQKKLFVTIESSDGFLLMIHALMGLGLCALAKLLIRRFFRSHQSMNRSDRD